MGGFWGKLKLAATLVFVAVMGVGIWRAAEVVDRAPVLVPNIHIADNAGDKAKATFTSSTLLRKSHDGRSHIYISRPLLNNDIINGDLQTFVDEQLALMAAQRAQDEEDGKTIDNLPVRELNVIFDLAFESEDHIAFSFEYGHYVGEEGSTRTHTRIYDKATGERLTLDDLFLPKSDYADALSAHVVSDLKLQAELRLDRFFTAVKDDTTSTAQLQALYRTIESEGVLDEKHNTDFAFTSDGALVFAFPESLVDPGRDGIVQAQVDYDALAEILAPAIRQAVPPAEPVTFETRPVDPVFVAAASDTFNENRSASPNCAIAKCVALTFDDGPGHFTNRLLDTLASNNVPATFFLVGHRVKFHTDDVKRMIVDGHEIGNHSWSHPRLVRLSDAQVRAQIERTNDVLEMQTGIAPELFRPPYGEYSTRVLNQIEMPVILWNHDTWDWRVLNAEIVAQRTANVTQSGSIVLLHDIHQTTVDAMPDAIAGLKNQGYTFVTISELFAPQVPQIQQVYSQREWGQPTAN